MEVNLAEWLGPAPAYRSMHRAPNACRAANLLCGLHGMRSPTTVGALPRAHGMT